MELRHKCSKGNTLERFLIGRFNPVIGRWTGIFVTCPPLIGPIIAGKFQFSGMYDEGRWTRKQHEEVEVFGEPDRLHFAAR
jgi:hypothetical protein